jgi:y4mF family transcriptional regulator
MTKYRGPCAQFLKQKRKELNLTQKALAQKSGVGLRFIRDVEQGKKTIRMDRLNMVLALFGYCAGPVRCEGNTNDNTQG